VFDFLHEHHIKHNDVLAQNAGVNVMTNNYAWFLEGLRDPSEVRYAVYDFGHSVIHPTDENWSAKEMKSVGRMFDIPFRHLQAQVPSFGLLLDHMQGSEDGLGLTSRQALERFQEIKSSSREQLESPVHNRTWSPYR
ncbi:hypothetical protein H0H93_001757, partial [Arthromyces matolae]